MKRTNLLALGALTVLAALTVVSQADALQTTRAFKEIQLNILVTPSPAPVGFQPAAPAAAPAPAAPVLASFGRLLEDPTRGPVQIASSGSMWDVAPGGGTLLAQVSTQPPPVPVQFVAKPDPNAAFLRIIPHFPAPDFIFHLPYGTTVFPCAFEIFTFYTTANQLTDWGYGTKLSGGPPPTYPIENYPTASWLSWAVPDFSPKVTAYANSGAPGQTTWTGAANQSQQHCIDLTFVVPNTQPAGSFTAVVQYNLIVN